MTSVNAPHVEGQKVNLYEVLQVTKQATPEEIKKSYRKLALRFHPDKNNGGTTESNQKFQQLSYANSILSDEYMRNIYDLYGEQGLEFSKRFGEHKLPKIFFKKWIRVLFNVVFFLSCCCGGCFCCCFCGGLCCCNCCCNGCCGKYAQKKDDEDYSRARAEEGPTNAD
uniref:J domain-containing protein n=1 Tax=Rhabditophanes sp. KR3021 TaxID=114890 RepID=A0AC35U8Q0_9BILA